MIALIALWTIAFFWSEVFVCGTNFTVLWKARETAAKYCDDHGPELLVFGITDVIGDILIVTMPFSPVRKLQMSRKEKWAVTAVFLLGTL